MDTDEKYGLLTATLRSYQKVVIAYSGGVDSTFLLKAAIDTLGPANVLPCIGISASLAQSQLQTAVKFVDQVGISVVQLQLDELEDEKYAVNKADRCFHCKSHLYSALKKVADENGIENILCGANFDDKDDFRPGNRAIQVFGIKAPLMDAQMTKSDIRSLSRMLGLETADMPASPCLASRIAYGTEVTEQNLQQVELAEDYIKSLGLIEFRVRHHGLIARIEVKENDFDKIISNRKIISEKLKNLGFKFVSLDLAPFSSGSLNTTLTQEEKSKAVDAE